MLLCMSHGHSQTMKEFSSQEEKEQLQGSSHEIRVLNTKGMIHEIPYVTEFLNTHEPHEIESPSLR